jgi:hypothetical protein
LKFNGKIQIPVCVHYDIILGRNVNTVKKKAETVLGATPQTRLEPETERTEYTFKFISLHQNSG